MFENVCVGLGRVINWELDRRASSLMSEGMILSPLPLVGEVAPQGRVRGF